MKLKPIAIFIFAALSANLAAAAVVAPNQELMASTAKSTVPTMSDTEMSEPAPKHLQIAQTDGSSQDGTQGETKSNMVIEQGGNLKMVPSAGGGPQETMPGTKPSGVTNTPPPTMNYGTKPKMPPPTSGQLGQMPQQGGQMQGGQPQRASMQGGQPQRGELQGGQPGGMMQPMTAGQPPQGQGQSSDPYATPASTYPQEPPRQ